MEISESVMREILRTARDVCRRPHLLGVEHDDIAQDVAMRLWQANQVEQVSSWIYRTTIRRTIDLARRHKRFHEVCSEYATEKKPTYVVDMDTKIAAEEIVNAATRVLKNETDLYVFLASGTRTLTQEEIARRTNLTTDCVTSKMRRAKDKVRAAMSAA